MTAILLAAMLTQAPDVPLMPPELVDGHGVVSVITGAEPLAPGTVCLTPEKAKLTRDDLTASHAKLDVYEASQPNWALIVGVSTGVALVVGAVAFGVGYSIKK